VQGSHTNVAHHKRRVVSHPRQAHPPFAHRLPANGTETGRVPTVGATDSRTQGQAPTVAPGCDGPRPVAGSEARTFSGHPAPEAHPVLTRPDATSRSAPDALSGPSSSSPSQRLGEGEGAGPAPRREALPTPSAALRPLPAAKGWEKGRAPIGRRSAMHPRTPSKLHFSQPTAGRSGLPTGRRIAKHPRRAPLLSAKRREKGRGRPGAPLPPDLTTPPFGDRRQPRRPPPYPWLPSPPPGYLARPRPPPHEHHRRRLLARRRLRPL
jgi:hypothetical protein